jgi:hypothetical protein
VSTADAPVVIPVPSPRFDSFAVLWREVNPGLWVARGQGDIIGSVEVVRSFIATDARGDVVGSFTTSDDAKSAVAQPTSRAVVSRRRRVDRRVVAEWGLILVLPTTGLVLMTFIAGMVIGW